MKRWKWIGVLALAVGLLGGAQPAAAQTITFDEFPSLTRVQEQYAPLGVHFATTGHFIMGGLSEGDPGNWDLEGTNGPHFYGVSTDPGILITLNFDRMVNTFTFDVSRGRGSSAGQTFTVSAFNGATQVYTQTLLMGAINSWSTITIPVSGYNKIQWTSSGTGLVPYGVDNIRFSTADAVPEPSSALLFLPALGVVGMIKRRCCSRRPVGGGLGVLGGSGKEGGA